MKPSPALARLLSASLLRMSARSPFFGTLALFARLEASEQINTAATDGKDIFVNEGFFTKLTAAEQDGLLLHEVLHAALLHTHRRNQRESKLWNIAADIVINGMILKAGFSLPAGGVRDARLENFSAEEVYEQILKNAKQYSLTWDDLLEGTPSDASGSGDEKQSPSQADVETLWRNAIQQAKAAEKAAMHGNLPAGLDRELKSLDASQLDWRSYLWRFLVRTPTDFGDFDRRFVGQGLYLETLSGESLRALVCVDTSGSIKESDLKMLVSEVQSILQAYPHIRCELFYADADLHGPWPLTANSPVPDPVGGGGTDFRPFFRAVAADADPFTPTVCIYLTDGFGSFPESAPETPTLWVVTAGGRDVDRFPFGEAVRLLPYS